MEKQRIYLLKCLVAGLCLTTVKLALFPPTDRQYAQPIFPEKIKVEQQAWQSAPSTAISGDNTPIENENEPKYHRILAHQRYGTTNRVSATMAMEISYVVRTQGSWHTFMDAKHLTVPESPDAMLDQSTPMGTYRLWQQGDTTHLYSCLHKRGLTTVTHRQFRKSQYRAALSLPTFISWLFQGSQLIEDTCLWLHLYSSAAGNSLDEAAKYMEPTWGSIVNWWQSL